MYQKIDRRFYHESVFCWSFFLIKMLIEEDEHVLSLVCLFNSLLFSFFLFCFHLRSSSQRLDAPLSVETLDRMNRGYGSEDNPALYFLYDIKSLS